MTPQPPVDKPSEQQAQRACGAACLSAVYKSLGKEVPASAIWPLIAKKNRLGSVASTTHLMTLHALSQGFSAVAIQARHPLHLLGLCRDRGIAAILNHRVREDSNAGHYSALAAIDDKTVTLNDAAFGVMRRMSHADLLRLWQPLTEPSEILGSTLIGIAAQAGDAPPCEFCHTAIPAQIDCPRCKKPVTLRPAALLGCIREGCIARTWSYLCCPHCDYVWTFNQAEASTGAVVPTAPSGDVASLVPEPTDFSAMFAALDRLTALIRSAPGAAQHADLQAQLGVLESGKEQLKSAQAEKLAALRARADWLTAMKAKSAEEIGAQRKKAEERNAPPAPLDGDALKEAVLKNVGLK